MAHLFGFIKLNQKYQGKRFLFYKKYFIKKGV